VGIGTERVGSHFAREWEAELPNLGAITSLSEDNRNGVLTLVDPRKKPGELRAHESTAVAR